MIESFGISGNVYIACRNAETFELIHEEYSKNMIVNSGLLILIDGLFTNTYYSPLGQIGFGTGSTAVLPTQVALVDTSPFYGSFTKSEVTYNFAGNETIKYYLNSSSANGKTIREIGLFDTDVSSIRMFSRIVLTTPIVKTSSVTVQVEWTLSVVSI